MFGDEKIVGIYELTPEEMDQHEALRAATEEAEKIWDATRIKEWAFDEEMAKARGGISWTQVKYFENKLILNK